MSELPSVSNRPQPLQAGVKLRGAEKVARIPVKILPTEEFPRKPDWIRVEIAASPEVGRIKALLRKHKRKRPANPSCMTKPDATYEAAASQSHWPAASAGASVHP
ncbi:hypothetical protein D3C87_1355050 [compost metagenome]